MKSHRSRIIVLIVVALAATHAGAQNQDRHFVAENLAPNSCKISCPMDSAYPGMSVIVSCTAASTPICQCSDPDRKMAYCDATHEIDPESPDAVQNPSSHAFRLNNSDLLAIQGPEGKAILSLENQANCQAYFEWRFKSAASSVESGGKGNLFEHYASLHGNNVISDVGGQLKMQIGPYELEWSCGGEEFGWVYKGNDPLEFSVIEALGLSDFPL